MNELNGFKIVESLAFVVQYRFPRTKKRRIRNKWEQREENYRPREDAIIDYINKVMHLHPTALQKLKNYESNR